MKKFRKLTKFEIVLLLIIFTFLLMGFTWIHGYMVLDLFETVKVACTSGDWLTLTNFNTVIHQGERYLTADLDCWIVTTQ